MEETRNNIRQYRMLAMCVLIFALAIVAYHLISAKMGFPAYRDIHLGTAIEYSHSKIDLLRPMIVGFNANKTPTAQELPIWQCAAAFFMKVGGGWYGWANLASLLLFFPCLYPLFQITKQYYNVETAWWCLLLFLSQPLVFIFSGEAATDGFCLSLSLWFFYFCLKSIERGSVISLIASMLFGAILAISKLPYFVAYGISAGLIFLFLKRNDLRAFVRLSTIALFSVAVFALWTKYTNHLLSLALFPLVNLDASKNPEMVFWYFGDLSYRLHLGNWIKGLWRLANATCGSFTLLVLVAYGFVTQWRSLATAILSACILTTLIFSHLILHHGHYYLMYCPAFAIFGAIGVREIHRVFLKDRSGILVKFQSAAAAVLALSLVQGLMGIHQVLQFDPYPKKMAAIIDRWTNANENVIIRGGGWGGELLFLSHRSGLSIWDTGFLDQSDNLENLKKLGYTKLVMVSESPLLHAVQISNPGAAEQKREFYTDSLLGNAKNWPSIYQDEEICIKSIP